MPRVGEWHSLPRRSRNPGYGAHHARQVGPGGYQLYAACYIDYMLLVSIIMDYMLDHMLLLQCTASLNNTACFSGAKLQP